MVMEKTEHLLLHKKKSSFEVSLIASEKEDKDEKEHPKHKISIDKDKIKVTRLKNKSIVLEREWKADIEVVMMLIIIYSKFRLYRKTELH